MFANGLHADATFPLRDLIARHSPIARDKATLLYLAAAIPDVNVQALAYFAASMFWRASIYPWRSDGRVPIDLGTSAELFRLFLLGQAEFPPTTSLLIAVRMVSPISLMTSEPMGEQRGPIYVARFPMPGIGFSIGIGDDLPQEYKWNCFVRGHGNPIMLTSRLEEILWRDGKRMLMRIQSRNL